MGSGGGGEEWGTCTTGELDEGLAVGCTIGTLAKLWMASPTTQNPALAKPLRQLDPCCKTHGDKVVVAADRKEVYALQQLAH